MLRFFLLLALLVFGGYQATAHAAEPTENTFDSSRPSAVRFYADWCSKCKLVDARLEDIRPEFLDEINFVVFEMTDESTRKQAQQKAQSLGLGAVYEKYAPATGLLILVDETGHIEQEITYAVPTYDMRRALADLL